MKNKTFSLRKFPAWAQMGRKKEKILVVFLFTLLSSYIVGKIAELRLKPNFPYYCYLKHITENLIFY